jgi:hypothetical protein
MQKAPVEFIEKYRVKFDWSHVGQYDKTPFGDKWAHNLWKVTLTNRMGKSVRVTYMTGLALDGPTKYGILESLAIDCRIVRDCDSAAELAHEFGYEDFDMAESIYDLCTKESRKLRDWCESEKMFADLLNIRD